MGIMGCTARKQHDTFYVGRGVLRYALTSNNPAQNTTHAGTHHKVTRGKFKSPSKTIDAIMRGYKGAVTKKINTLRGLQVTPVWQRNYHEHIIRDGKSYLRIADYQYSAIKHEQARGWTYEVLDVL